MSICEPCRIEGKGAIIAHYEADRSTGRPAMCYDHYRAIKNERGFVPSTQQPKPVVDLERTMETVSCSQKGCVFPAVESGLCIHHARVERSVLSGSINTEPEREVESRGSEVSDRSKHDGRLKNPGRKPGGNYKLEQRGEAAAMLKQGFSVRRVAGKLELSRNTVMSVRKKIAAELPEFCKCGAAAGHRGWCTNRLTESPKRQEMLKTMQGHNTRYSLEQRQQVEKLLREGVDVKSIENATGVKRQTVYEIRRPIYEELPETKWPPWGYCACGKKVSHPGRCSGHTKDKFQCKAAKVSDGLREVVMKKETTTAIQTINVTQTLEHTVSEEEPSVCPVGMRPSLDHATDWIDGRIATSISTLYLASGGNIQFFQFDVNMLQMSRDDREFMVALADLIARYVHDHPYVKKPLEAEE
jgi:uncharacterized protein YerC